MYKVNFVLFPTATSKSRFRFLLRNTDFYWTRNRYFSSSSLPVHNWNVRTRRQTLLIHLFDRKRWNTTILNRTYLQVSWSNRNPVVQSCRSTHWHAHVDGLHSFFILLFSSHFCRSSSLLHSQRHSLVKYTWRWLQSCENKRIVYETDTIILIFRMVIALLAEWRSRTCTPRLDKPSPVFCLRILIYCCCTAKP